MATPRIFRQSQRKVIGKVLQLTYSVVVTVVYFNPQKREFSVLLIIPVPPIQCWDITTITRPDMNVFLNMGPWAGGRRKTRGKKKQPSQHF